MSLALGSVAAIILGSCLALLLILLLWILVFIACMAVLARPWDGTTSRDHRWATMAPYFVFWMAAWIVRAAEKVVALKPGTLRAAELATAYTQSQVLFAVVNLRIPDLLCAGPQTSADLAAAIGLAVPVEWLERLLATAAALGMLNRTKATTTTAAPQQSSARMIKAGSTDEDMIESEDVEAVKDQNASTQQQQQQHLNPAATRYLYSLNGVSAVLTSESPVNISSMVKMFEDHYAGYAYLSEGIASGKVPFELWSGGRSFWDHIASSPRHAATFDAAMLAVNHTGGTAVVSAYPWRRFDCVIDVAGGVGGFLADLLERNPRLRGMVLDQQEQIERGRKLWEATRGHLSPRAQLVAGNMFDSSTIPRPPSRGKVAYTLRNILHDWSDADSVAILCAIRACIAPEDVSSGRVQLLVVEVTTVEEVLPCHLAFRRSSDMTMLMAYGDGKERSKQQFEALFRASGFKLQHIKPTCGLLMVLEAVPV